VVFSSEFDSGNLSYVEEVFTNGNSTCSRKFELYVASDPKNTLGMFDPET
jgi:hypothetical protein